MVAVAVVDVILSLQPLKSSPLSTSTLLLKLRPYSGTRVGPYQLVDEIPLSRPKRNIARDFADGVLVAEAVAHFYPRLVVRTGGYCSPRHPNHIEPSVIQLDAVL